VTPPLAFPSFPSFLAGMRRRSILMSCAGVDARFGGETPLPGRWSGRWGTRTLDLSRVKVLIRFSLGEATRRQTALTRTNDNARRREKTAHDSNCGAFCGEK
jgi:hypothetical protein